MYLIVKDMYKAGIENGQYCVFDIDGKARMIIVKQDDLYQGFLIDDYKPIEIKKTPVVNDLRLLNHLLEKLVGNDYIFTEV